MPLLFKAAVFACFDWLEVYELDSRNLPLNKGGVLTFSKLPDRFGCSAHYQLA